MTLQTITLRLPEESYRRLQGMATALRRPLEEVASQTIRGNLPPAVDDLPAEFQDELAAWSNLSDEQLWRIALDSLPPDQWRRHRRLLRKNEANTLTDAEREELARLRAATDRFVVRRSYALALLKWRGHTLPISPMMPTRADAP
ncbi:MAG: hypothetical protein WAV74_23425 [Anaerolineae bacterium]|nr:hypothetical protein [Anaerolineae bacterium]